MVTAVYSLQDLNQVGGMGRFLQSPVHIHAAVETAQAGTYQRSQAVPGSPVRTDTHEYNFPGMMGIKLPKERVNTAFYL